jgi:hypothetical protein
MPSEESDQARDGIVAPNGTHSCSADGNETSYVRHYGAEDNAGKLFLALYGHGSSYNDASQRVNAILEDDIWQSEQ